MILTEVALFEFVPADNTAPAPEKEVSLPPLPSQATHEAGRSLPPGPPPRSPTPAGYGAGDSQIVTAL